jgi:anthraniloyl-CoA monooxygenase
MGDAAHTAHFSIGSGTKLAMEDAIALADAVGAPGATCRRARRLRGRARLDVLKVQRAAQTSLEWFENSERYMEQDPERFVFNLMTRSRRITYDNLRKRDPALVARDRGRRGEGRSAGDGPAPPPAFTPFTLRGLQLRQPRRGVADVPVLGDRRRARRLGTSCTSAAARSAAPASCSPR